ncbi:MAG: type I-F CRISPR-associated protein Csy1, partial [Candidatus Competibacteraceae bacterium]|nr:type I-F CRISPR-associated protein Csy1 [Candidatus Competibacteraceae bacterium]
AQIGHRFANWLNTQLEGRLPVGDAEFRQWKKELLIDEDDGGWAQQLHRLRKELDAPTYIPVREGQV